MTRILTIIALLFATPAWAVDYLNCSGKVSYQGQGGPVEFVVEMRRDPVRFTIRGDTFDECRVTSTKYSCSIAKGSAGFGSFRLNRMNLDIKTEMWIPNRQTGLNEKMLVKGNCVKAKQQL
jgi:hypothetical protein